MKSRICLPWNGFLRLACTCEETRQSVWPPNASLYASSAGVYLRLLAGPFDLRALAMDSVGEHQENMFHFNLKFCGPKYEFVVFFFQCLASKIILGRSRLVHVKSFRSIFFHCFPKELGKTPQCVFHELLKHSLKFGRSRKHCGNTCPWLVFLSCSQTSTCVSTLHRNPEFKVFYISETQKKYGLLPVTTLIRPFR